MNKQQKLDMPPHKSKERGVNLELERAYEEDHILEEEAGYDDLEELKRLGWFRYEGIPEEDESFPYDFNNPMPEEEEINWELEHQLESIVLGYRGDISETRPYKPAEEEINQKFDEAYAEDKSLEPTEIDLRKVIGLGWFRD